MEQLQIEADQKKKEFCNFVKQPRERFFNLAAVNIVTCFIIYGLHADVVISGANRYYRKLSLYEELTEDFCKGIRVYEIEAARAVWFDLIAYFSYCVADIVAAVFLGWSIGGAHKPNQVRFHFWLALQILLFFIVVIHAFLQIFRGQFHGESQVNHGIVLFWKLTIIILCTFLYEVRKRRGPGENEEKKPEENKLQERETEKNPEGSALTQKKTDQCQIEKEIPVEDDCSIGNDNTMVFNSCQADKPLDLSNAPEGSLEIVNATIGLKLTPSAFLETEISPTSPAEKNPPTPLEKEISPTFLEENILFVSPPKAFADLTALPTGGTAATSTTTFTKMEETTKIELNEQALIVTTETSAKKTEEKVLSLEDTPAEATQTTAPIKDSSILEKFPVDMTEPNFKKIQFEIDTEVHGTAGEVPETAPEVINPDTDGKNSVAVELPSETTRHWLIDLGSESLGIWNQQQSKFWEARETPAIMTPKFEFVRH